MSKRTNAWQWRDYVRAQPHDRAPRGAAAPLGSRDQPYDVRVRDFKENIMRPLVLRMLRNAPETWWSILNYWGFGPESYASESDKRKWYMASDALDLTDADATAALRDLLGEIATDRGGVWFLNDEYNAPEPPNPEPVVFNTYDTYGLLPAPEAPL